MKFDQEKPKYRLIYTSMMDYVSRVRSFGATKYPDPESWRTTEPIQHMEAAERHIRAAMGGEWLDKESGLPHLAHAICNCMFELERLGTQEVKTAHNKEQQNLSDEELAIILSEKFRVGGQS